MRKVVSQSVRLKPNRIHWDVNSPVTKRKVRATLIFRELIACFVFAPYISVAALLKAKCNLSYCSILQCYILFMQKFIYITLIIIITVSMEYGSECL